MQEQQLQLKMKFLLSPPNPPQVGGDPDISRIRTKQVV